ncbi:hypothetical protein [Dyadobacter sp. CY356]|uniref:hypothetical protein n=1 Tax=Dyadobacter sp. CY356 TaxID=2906442 RepID=UPI001F344572|nr:hypothetical protein [Dyadobacter sp. CY356]MCF0057290.1 hypothetical protein [Dyadobacter sp. CY356]
MKKWMFLGSFALMLGLAGCNDSDNGSNLVLEKVVTSDFELNTDDWTAALSEYSTETDTSSVEFRSGRTTLPTPLDTKTYGYMLQSHNRSDDMFMYLKKKITGLRANSAYNVTFEIDLATDNSSGGFGTGGSPGSSVYLKAGASAVEPVTNLVSGFYTFNLDKGIQSESGKDLINIGNAANGLETDTYAIVKRDNLTKPVTVTADANGAIWVCVGTDSGFEGLTRLYYDKIKVSVTEVLPD